jgi:hypothetical protein
VGLIQKALGFAGGFSVSAFGVSEMWLSLSIATKLSRISLYPQFSSLWLWN